MSANDDISRFLQAVREEELEYLLKGTDTVQKELEEMSDEDFIRLHEKAEGMKDVADIR